MKIDVILSPKDLPAPARRDLRGAVCVVFDVLRATSTMVTALHHGARAIVPVAEIAEALAIRRQQPDILLGGERDGVRIRSAQTGDVDFDLGNSPREYTAAVVRDKTIVSTTTNGTRALRACAGAQTVLAASFLNLSATASWLRQVQPTEVMLVCAGTRENVATEDVLAAGALVEMLLRSLVANQAQAGTSRCDVPAQARMGGSRAARTAQRAVPTLSRAAQTALNAWRKGKANLLEAVSAAENARRLLALPELRDDVAFCLQQDIFGLVAALGRDGAIRISV